MLRPSHHHFLKSLIFVFFLSIVACKSGSSPAPAPPAPGLSLGGTSWSGSVGTDTSGSAVTVKLTFGADGSYGEDWGIHGKFSGNYAIAGDKLTITSADGAVFAGNGTIVLQNNGNTLIMTDDGGQSITLQKVTTLLPPRPSTIELTGPAWEDVKASGGGTEYRFTITFNSDGTFLYFDPVSNKTTRGTYRVARDQLTITGTVLGGTYTFSILAESGREYLEFGAKGVWHQYSRATGVPPVPDVTNPLSETKWKHEEPGSGSVTITYFKEDGTYIFSNGSGVVMERGTYIVDGGNLSMTNAVGGSVQRLTISIGESYPRQLFYRTSDGEEGYLTEIVE